MRNVLFLGVVIGLVAARVVFAADMKVPVHHKHKKATVVIGKTALPKEDDKLGRPAGMP